MLGLLSKIKDPVSCLTHLFGALLSVVAMTLMVYGAAALQKPVHALSFAIFGLSLILLYSASSAYHMFNLPEKGTLRLKKIDHMMIYVLIAGTYTPFCLIALEGTMKWVLFITIWSLAVIGMFFKLFWIKAPRWVSVAFYLFMGWLAVFTIPDLIGSVPAGAITWTVIGGLSYSVGAVIYGFKKPDPFPEVFGFHEIWHLFVLGGSFSHFWVMYRYLMYVG
ncbi:MAG: hemolysin III family protein [Balneolaceae bacterium]|nr:MAG: hemolysin III family protein [Balneolaceae bacterium]